MLISFLGLPLGVFQTIPVVYALELAPMCLRAHLTTYINLCWVRYHKAETAIWYHRLTNPMDRSSAKFLLAACCELRLTSTLTWHSASHLPFSRFSCLIQPAMAVLANCRRWVWPVILIPLIYFAPESPWWLVRQGRLDEARQVVVRITSPSQANFDVDNNVALMVETTNHEREVKAATSYLSCFTGTDLRRTIIVIGCNCIQVLSGNPLRAYATYFFQQAGLPTSQAFNMTIVSYVLGMVGVFIAVSLILGVLAMDPVANEPVSGLSFLSSAAVLCTCMALAPCLQFSYPSEALASRSPPVPTYRYPGPLAACSSPRPSSTTSQSILSASLSYRRFHRHCYEANRLSSPAAHTWLSPSLRK